jgi:hypothetical protein
VPGRSFDIVDRGEPSAHAGTRRRVPVDLLAFVTIAIVLLVMQKPFLRYGMCFSDSAWYYHFGRRALAGQVPYRDYVFQVGPLPIYVDAVFQAIFGSKYMASLYAALFLKILRVFAIWALARRLAGVTAASLLAVFCALDVTFGWAYHWSWGYAELFIILSGLCCVLAARAASETRARVWLCLAGLNAGLIVSTRQATAVMIGIVLFAATSLLTARKEFFTPRRFLMLWCGFAVGIITVLGALAVGGALRPALQQMFLDAPGKKEVHGLNMLLDPLSGGTLTQSADQWQTSLLPLLLLSVALVAFSLYRLVRDHARFSLAMLLVPAVMLLGLVVRDASDDLFYVSDVPRTFLTAIAVVAIVIPDRARRQLGIDPIVAIGLGVLPLASEWALQLSVPGPGWTDTPALVVGVFLILLASSRVRHRWKLVACGALAATAVAHTALLWRADVNSFTVNPFNAFSDGRFTETRFTIKNPVLRGTLVSESRKKAVDWLVANVKPGSTCFVYGTLPILYDILRCKNPTRVDVTIPDFFSRSDAADAVATLRMAPPDYLISCEISWLSPPLTIDLTDDTVRWSPMNWDAAKTLHVGLRSILDQYESVGLIGDLLGPALSKQASQHWDNLQGVRLYHRRR